MARKVYLDQNAWIHLSRCHHGENGDWSDAYNAVMEASEVDEVDFPLSLSHFQETVRRNDDKSRTRLLEFMWEISGGHALRPWPGMLEPEARNAVRALAHGTRRDLTGFVFGQGLPQILGAQPRLVPKTPDATPPSEDVQRELAEAVYGSTAWAFLKDPGFAASVREDAGLDDDFADRIQAMVDEEYSQDDKTRKREVAEARFMISVVRDALCRAMVDIVPHPKPVMTACLGSKEAIRGLLRLMPTFHTYHTLNYVRNTTQEVDQNDLWDFVLNIAIPYCDVVVTERSWCNIAEQHGIHELRDTRMVSAGQPGDLVEALST